MRQQIFQAASFLIVDDEPANVSILEQLLDRWGYTNIHSTTNSREAAALFQTVQPDIVLLDLMMPEVDGFEVMAQLEPLISASDYLPILVLTADLNTETKRRALSQGARDFLTKPFDREELALRLENLLQTRLLHQELRNRNDGLETKVAERTQQIKKAEIETLECLAAAAEYRDDDTGQHTQRVGELAGQLALRLGLTQTMAESICRAAPLHDIGKIGISDLILLKPDKLSEAEYTIMQHHTFIGAGILSRYHTPLLQLAQNIALTHHERWNGAGYPRGLQGEEIPIEGRIVAIVDVFDALTHERPYKKAWSIAEALAEIECQKGKQFDEQVVKAFLTLPLEDFI